MVDRFEAITLAMAEKMSENELQLEIEKRNKYLREELGMDRFESANFVSSLLNMGVAMNRILKSKKSPKEK